MGCRMDAESNDDGDDDRQASQCHGGLQNSIGWRRQNVAGSVFVADA